MPQTTLRVLLVEDDQDDYILTRDLLAESEQVRFKVDWAASSAAGREAMLRGEHDAYLVDWRLGDADGLDLVREAVRAGCRAPVIMLTGQERLDIDLEAMQAGAADYLVKGRIDAPLLERAIRYAVERTRTREIQRFLAEASQVLARSLDVDETLRTVTRLAVPVLGQCCIIYYSGIEGDQWRAASAHVDPIKEPLLHEMVRRYRPSSDRPPSFITEVMRTRTPYVGYDASDAGLADVAQSPEKQARFRALAAAAVMAVPLVGRATTLGVLIFVRTAPDATYSDADLALAEAFAQRAALTIDNASLYYAAKLATRARDDVLAMVSHDLRNPVSTIMMSASFMLDVIDGDPGPGLVRQQAAIIKRQAQHMHRLIEDLLEVARIEAGRLSIELKRLELGPLVTELCEAFDAQLTAKRQWLGHEIASGVPPVLADRARVQQVLTNLIGNAAKFIPEGGSVTIRAESAGREVRLAVADTGPGIPAEHLSHLFEPFWQARKTGREGAGLGLTITKAIVEAHGGRIWVESTVGQGTTFFFTLPAADYVQDRARDVTSERPFTPPARSEPHREAAAPP